MIQPAAIEKKGMRRLELPPEEAKKLVSSEKAASFPFRMVHVGFAVAVLGAIAFMIAFFYQKPISAAGLPYREAQAGAIVVVFIGWMIFNFSCGALGISARKLTYKKMMSILRNQVEQPFDEQQAMRKKVATSLSTLGEQWTLFPAVFADDPGRCIPMVIVGPGGVFPVNMVTEDPKKFSFVDPSPSLLAGSAELQKRLKTDVQPVIGFFRHRKNYQNPHEEIKLFTLPELYAYLENRPATLGAVEKNQIEADLKYLANLPR